jgi:hypothetical protein
MAYQALQLTAEGRQPAAEVCSGAEDGRQRGRESREESVATRCDEEEEEEERRRNLSIV